MSKIIRTTVLVVLRIVWLLPAYLLVVNAMKDPTTFTSKKSWIPTDFHLFENFGQALEALRHRRQHRQHAHLFDRVADHRRSRGRRGRLAIVALRLKRGFLWFVVIFGGTVFPLQMVLLPLFDAHSRTGLFDTRVGMIMIYTVISIPFSAFVMRNFFTGVAHNVFEAAVLDGATTWRIFVRLYLPMASRRAGRDLHPAGHLLWNDLLLGLTLSQSDDIRPIITTLSGMQSTYGGAPDVGRARCGRTRLAADRNPVPVHPAVSSPRASRSDSTDPQPASKGIMNPLIPTVEDLVADAVTPSLRRHDRAHGASRTCSAPCAWTTT
ncbi:carbohydrate ABC transporter permease [Microbacterium oxydans]|nr:carbohydrate ABC transporter permease [Microbacterium oxydans]